MKKELSAVIAVLMLFSFLESVLAVENDGKSVGKVGKVYGEAWVERGAGKRAGLKEGGDIYNGDTISTSAGGKVTLLFTGDNRVILGYDTRLKIDELLFDNNNEPKDSTLELLAGKIKAFIKKIVQPGSQFQIRTKDAAIAVLGTEFITTLDGRSGDLAVFVNDGAVGLASGSGLWKPLRIERGNTLKLQGGKKPGKIQRFDRAAIADLEKELSETAAAPPRLAQEIKKIKQKGWEKMLVDALPFENSPDFPDYPEEQYSQLLIGKPDGSIPVDQFKKSMNNPQLIEIDGTGNLGISVAEQAGTVFYYVVVPKSGEVKMSGTLRGGAQYWTFDKAPTRVTRNQVVAEKVEIGAVNLAKGGIKRLGVSIPKDGLLMDIGIEAACRNPIVPKKGWDPEKELTNRDMVSNLLQALKWGDRLEPDKSRQPITLKREGKRKEGGGLSGFEYGYKPFRLKEAGFFRLLPKNPWKNVSDIILDGCLKEKFIPKTPEEGSIRDQALAVFYLTIGDHQLAIRTKSETDPGELYLKPLDDSYEAMKEIFKDTGFLISGEDEPVDENVARTNATLLEEYLGAEEDALDEFIIPPRQEEEIIKRRSLSPVLPEL